MDHYGFLNVFRAVDLTLRDVQYKRDNTKGYWKLAITPLVFPEMRCPFCKIALRSNYVWLISDMPHPRLHGAFKPEGGKKYCVFQPSHPHDCGGGALCRGKHNTVAELFAAGVNLDDCPMGTYRVPRWFKEHFNHTCKEARDYLASYADNETYQRYLREYNTWFTNPAITAIPPEPSEPEEVEEEEVIDDLEESEGE